MYARLLPARRACGRRDGAARRSRRTRWRAAQLDEACRAAGGGAVEEEVGAEVHHLDVSALQVEGMEGEVVVEEVVVMVVVVVVMVVVVVVVVAVAAHHLQLRRHAALVT